MNKNVLAVVAAGALFTGCGEQKTEDSPLRPAQAQRPTLSQNPEQIRGDITETGNQWVDVATSDPDELKCYIDMAHTLKDRLVVESITDTGGTPCEVGDLILPGQIPENYNETLEQYRTNWDNAVAAIGLLITDGKDESIMRVKDHTWVEQVGQISLAAVNSHPVVQFNDGQNGRQYGARSCSLGRAVYSDVRMGNIDNVRILGQISDDVTSYKLGIVLSGEEAGAPCSKGNLVLIPIERQEPQVLPEDSASGEH